MHVLKFGGTSVANATNISRVIDIVRSAAAKDRVILVSSAISGCTDKLIAIEKASKEGKSFTEEIKFLKDKHFDIINRLFTGSEKKTAEEKCEEIFKEISTIPDGLEAYGELLSTNILAYKLSCEGEKTKWINSREIIIKGDIERTYANIRKVVDENADMRILVAPGFIASDTEGRITTLGRGGSDYSAALYAAGCSAGRLDIWTDVPGIMTTNPKDVSKAQTVPFMSYDAAWCLAEHGAKVLYPPTVEPAKNIGLDIHILNTFDPANPGTVIGTGKASSLWVGISLAKDTLCLVADDKFDRREAANMIENTLKRCSIDVMDISFDKGCVLVKVAEGLEKEALKALHKEFFQIDENNTRLLYIAGKGAVGTALRNMIDKTSENIKAASGKVLKVMAQVDSSDPGFCERLVKEAPKNAVFVDVTDSEDIYKWYKPLLEAGVNIVSSNRRSLSVPYREYAAMKQAARINGAFLRYETTVGAALPVLGSIALSANTNDEITDIEAVVSCTLNYILSSGLPFGQALKKAQDIGLTEKDPSQDLEGRDALRKLIILAREAGVHLDERDVEIEPVKDMMQLGPNQRFVASLKKDSLSPLGYKAEIRLQTVDMHHPAYWIKGTDNLIIVKSAYHPTPLVIQGAGEGARQAASSVLNDILK